MPKKIKNLLQKLKSSFYAKYVKIVARLNKQDNLIKVNKEYKFQKLTPSDEVPLNIYEEAINYIFENSDVVNVAISGAYGAGKSSVIASYKKRYSSLKFIYISLAHFKTSDEDETDKKNKTINESILEGKILNQLIHQISSDKIPQTNFKVKQSVKTKRPLCTTFFTMLLIISLVHIVFFSKWSEYVSLLNYSWLKDLLLLTINPYLPLFSGALCMIMACNFIYKLVRMQMNKNIFRKFSFQGNEIEIFEESSESYFDKYLNEVLYLFENVDVDVIVFEDIDRFSLSSIFERLREINTLANIQLKNKNKPPIRFFYLVRDDIFISKDRTKFFDYIIPIVPVVDSSNSYDQFINHFKQGGIYHLFDENFLQGISLYIDDMRILKNIYNEFLIYYNSLNTTDLDCHKMLSMITYKNLFPRDFSQLQLNQGMVYTIFAQKNIFIDKELERLNILANQKRKEIDQINNEHLNSIQELNDVYDKLKSRMYNSGISQHRHDYETKLKEEFPRREKNINNKFNNRHSELEDELVQIELEISRTSSKLLKELITRENIDLFFKVTAKNEIGVETDFNDIKGSDYFDLLKYLIREGYINETYPDYMTFFYSNSLVEVDKKFLRSITDKNAKEYNYQLKNPKLITNRLRLADFDQEEILNFDLLQYLLNTPDRENFLNRFLLQLKYTKNYKFIGEYFDTKRVLFSYVKHLNRQWPEMLKVAVEENKLTGKQIRSYSIYTLYYSNIEEIQEVNSEDFLTHYISSSNDYLDITEPNIEKLIDGFILLNVSFKGIKRANEELLKAIYMNSLYVINFENIVLMLKNFYVIHDEDDIYLRNYTLVLSQPDAPLAQYVQKNICDYLREILTNPRAVIIDDLESVLLILNNEDVTLDQKVEYIKLLQTPVSLISSVKDSELWIYLLQESLIEYSEENIIRYFEYTKTLDELLITYINSNDSVLNFTAIKNTYGDEKTEEFFDAVIECNQLSNPKYTEILTSLKYTYESFNIQEITDEKFRILVDKHIVPMEPGTLKFVREYYPSELLNYIRNNITNYTDLMNTELFVLKEVLDIIAWDISDDIKIKLLKLTNVQILISNKRYSDTINAYILDNNFDDYDLYKLCETYDEWNQEIQQLIFKISIKNISRIIGESINVCKNLLILLLESIELNRMMKIELFISAIRNMSMNECKEYLDLLDLTEYKKVFEPRTRPKYEMNEISEKLLKAFQDNKWIDSFQEDNEKNGYYKLIRSNSNLKEYLLNELVR